MNTLLRPKRPDIRSREDLREFLRNEREHLALYVQVYGQDEGFYAREQTMEAVRRLYSAIYLEPEMGREMRGHCG